MQLSQLSFVSGLADLNSTGFLHEIWSNGNTGLSGLIDTVLYI